MIAAPDKIPLLAAAMAETEAYALVRSLPIESLSLRFLL